MIKADKLESGKCYTIKDGTAEFRGVLYSSEIDSVTIGNLGSGKLMTYDAKHELDVKPCNNTMTKCRRKNGDHGEICGQEYDYFANNGKCECGSGLFDPSIGPHRGS